MTGWPAMRERGDLAGLYRNQGLAAFVGGMFDAAHRGEVDTWDVQWAYSCLAQRQMWSFRMPTSSPTSGSAARVSPVRAWACLRAISARRHRAHRSRCSRTSRTRTGSTPSASGPPPAAAPSRPPCSPRNASRRHLRAVSPDRRRQGRSDPAPCTSASPSSPSSRAGSAARRRRPRATRRVRRRRRARAGYRAGQPPRRRGVRRRRRRGPWRCTTSGPTGRATRCRPVRSRWPRRGRCRSSPRATSRGNWTSSTTPSRCRSRRTGAPRVVTVPRRPAPRAAGDVLAGRARLPPLGLRRRGAPGRRHRRAERARPKRARTPRRGRPGPYRSDPARGRPRAVHRRRCSRSRGRGPRPSAALRRVPGEPVAAQEPRGPDRGAGAPAERGVVLVLTGHRSARHDALMELAGRRGVASAGAAPRVRPRCRRP